MFNLRNQEKDKLIELLQNDISKLKTAMKAHDDKVNRLKINLEDRDKTIKNFEDKVKNYEKRIATKDRIIEHQFKTIARQSKELKSKDGIINQLRKENEDDRDIQLTEVIREREFIEVHTLVDNDDREEETSQITHCDGCQCLVNAGIIFESDLAKKMKREDVKSEIKSEMF